MVLWKIKKVPIKGFTSTELLIVLAIIAMLSVVVAPSSLRAIENAKVTKAISDISTFHSATMAYYTDIGSFPADAGTGYDPGFNTSYNKTVSTISNWQGPYVSMSASNGQLPKNPWGGSYDYELLEANENSSKWQKSVAGVWISIRGIPNRDIAENLIQKTNLDILQGDPSEDSSNPKFLKISFRIIKFN